MIGGVFYYQTKRIHRILLPQPALCNINSFTIYDKKTQEDSDYFSTQAPFRPYIILKFYDTFVVLTTCQFDDLSSGHFLLGVSRTTCQSDTFVAHSLNPPIPAMII